MHRTLIAWPNGQLLEILLSFIPTKGEHLFDGFYCEWCIVDRSSILVMVSRKPETNTERKL